MIKLAGLSDLSPQLCCMLRPSIPAALFLICASFRPRSSYVCATHCATHLVVDESRVMVDRVMLSPTLAAGSPLFLVRIHLGFRVLTLMLILTAVRGSLSS